MFNFWKIKYNLGARWLYMKDFNRIKVKQELMICKIKLLFGNWKMIKNIINNIILKFKDFKEYFIKI